MTDAIQIPFLDLVTPHGELKEELCGVFRTALESAAFIGGRMVVEFENAFAKFCDVRTCVGVGSGTDALRFALIAADVKEGDIVITVPNTFVATTEAISQSGAKPAFVDVDERTYNMDPKRLRQYLETACDVNERTGAVVERKSGRPVVAVVPVHLYGQMADMDPIMEVAEEFGLTVIEDACQAHGAEYFSKRHNCWQKAGSIGRAAAFSFYPGKNLGACGEAGAVTTNCDELAQKIRMLRDHGQSQKYYHDIEGYNGRLDSVQAGVLHIKLGHLEGWNQKRRESARCYQDLLGPVEGIVLPQESVSSKAVYHVYVVQVEGREQLQRHLTRANIGTAIHYPVPLHLQKAYDQLGFKTGDFPVVEHAAARILSLPMYPGLKREQQVRIAEQVAEFVGSRQTRVMTAGMRG